MKKVFPVLVIIIGVCLIIYAFIVLVNCFTLLSAAEFNSLAVGYTLGTIVGPLLLMAVARRMIRKAVKVLRQGKTH